MIGNLGEFRSFRQQHDCRNMFTVLQLRKCSNFFRRFAFFLFLPVEFRLISKKGFRTRFDGFNSE